MSLSEEILSKITVLSQQEVNFTETSNLNEVHNLAEGLNCIVTTATVFHVGLKNIPYLIKNEGKRSAVKTYQMYHQALQSFAEETQGSLVDYDCKSFLIIYPSSHKDINAHIKNALKLSYILGKLLPKKIEKIGNTDFGIGIDHGRIMGVKSNNGIHWYGICIDKAATIGSLCLKPSYVGISGLIYSELDEELKIHTNHILGIPKKENAWQKGSYQFENEHKHYYTTHHTIETE